ncbi:MAG: hypothetical protein GY771_16865 [bacterium]|nr:hypothetical protein [bacterium]
MAIEDKIKGILRSLGITVRAIWDVARWLFLLTALIVIAGGVLGWALYSRGYFHDAIEREGVRFLTDFTDVEVRFGGVSGDLISGVVIRDVVFGNGPNIEEDGVAIRVEELRIKYNPLKLLTGKIIINSVYLQGGEVNLLRDPDGRINLARIFGEEEKKPPDPNFYLEISHIELDDVDYIMDIGAPMRDFEELHLETSLTVVRDTVFLDIGDCSCYLPEYNQWLPSFGNGNMTINDRRITFRKVKIESPTTSIICSGAIVNKGEEASEMNLEFVADPIDIGECLSGVMDIPPDVYGVGRYRGKLYGTGEELVQEGRLEIERGYAFGFPLRDFNAEYDFDIANETLLIKEAEGRISDTYTQAYGTVYLPVDGTPMYQVEGYIENLDVGGFTGNDDLSSDVDALVSVSGYGFGDSPSLAIFGEIGPGRIGPVDIDGALVNLNVVGDELFFEQADVAIGEGTASLVGGFSGADIELQITGEDIPLDRFSFEGLDEGLSGVVSLDGYIYGNPAFPSFDGDIIGSDVRLGKDVYLGSARAEGVWSELGAANEGSARLYFWDAEVYGVPFSNGSADIASSREFVAIDGGRVEFTRDRYFRFSALFNSDESSLTVNEGGYVFPGGELVLANPWSADFSGNRITFGGGNAVYGDGYVDLSGWVEPERGAFDVYLLSENMPVGDLFPPTGDFYYDGILIRGEIRGEGNFKSPDITAEFLVEDVYLNNEYLETVKAKAVLEKDIVMVHRLEVVSGSGELYGAGVFPIGVLSGSAEGEVDINVAADSFDITVVNAFTETDIIDAGTVSGMVLLSGPVESPETKVELSFDGIVKDTVSYDWAIVELNYVDDLITIEEISIFNGSERALNLSGRAAFDLGYTITNKEPADGPLNIDVELDGLGLSVLNLSSDEFLITDGGIYGDFGLTGSIREPLLNGDGVIRDGGGIIRFLRSEIRNLNGRFTVDDNVFTVASENPMYCSIDEGDMVFSGTLATERLTPTELDMELTAKDYLVKIIPGVRAMGDIEVYRISGPLDSPYIEGLFVVKNGLITMPFASEDRGTYGEPTGEDGINFKFDVVTDGELWLRNSTADILLDADMEVSSENGEIRFAGELNSIRGTYYFLKRDFFIDEADIIFTGEPELNPVLNITGHNFIRGVDEDDDPETITVEIYVTGRTDDIAIQLYCPDYPHLEQKDLMIMLAMDITWAEYQNMSKGDIAAKESKEYVRRMAEKELARLVRRGTGLDYLHFETASREEETEIEVKVGHFVTDDLFVAYTGTYEEKPGAKELEHAFETEYRLVKRFYLVGETFNEEGKQRFGTSIKYKMKY